MCLNKKESNEKKYKKKRERNNELKSMNNESLKKMAKNIIQTGLNLN